MTAHPFSIQQRDLPSPFPGLHPYDENNAYFFFGREAHLNEVKLQLGTNRLVSIMGSNESGKTSLIHAGLISGLKKDGFEVNGRKDWIITSFTPRNSPVSDLALALALTKFKPDLIDKNRLEFLIHTLDSSGSKGIVQVYKTLKLNQNKNLLIVIDHFDELFRQLELNVGDDTFRDEAEKFINLILTAGQQERYPIYFLLSMRPDLMTKAGGFPGLIEAINEGQYILPELSKEEIAQVGAETLSKLREEYPRHWGGKSEMQKNFNNEIKRVLDKAGKDEPKLAIAQVALLRLWKNERETKLIDDVKLILDKFPDINERKTEIERLLPKNAPFHTLAGQLQQGILAWKPGKIEKGGALGELVNALQQERKLALELFEDFTKQFRREENKDPHKIFSQHANEVYNKLKKENVGRRSKRASEIANLIKEYTDQDDLSLLFRIISKINAEKRNPAKEEKDVAKIEKFINEGLKRIALTSELEKFLKKPPKEEEKEGFFKRLFYRIKRIFSGQFGSNKLKAEISKAIKTSQPQTSNSDNVDKSEIGILFRVEKILRSQKKKENEQAASEIRKFINQEIKAYNFWLGMLKELDISFSQQHYCEKIFKALLHTSVENLSRPVRPVKYDELKKLFAQPVNSGPPKSKEKQYDVSHILKKIKNYRTELINATEKDPKISRREANDIWAKDPIGNIMISNRAKRIKNEVSVLQFRELTTTQQDQLLKEEVIEPFLGREVGILNRFNQSPKLENGDTFKIKEEVRQKPPILETTSIFLTNEYLLDETWGWDKLVEWKDEEEEASIIYRKLLEATAAFFNEGTKQQDNDLLWTNPADLGNGIRWLLQHSPNAAWAQRYDEAYQNQPKGVEGVGFNYAMEFLSKSIDSYANEHIEIEKKKVEALEKERKKKRQIGFWAAICFALAIMAGLSAGWAQKQKGRAVTERQNAIDAKELASDFAVKAEREQLNAEIAKGIAEKAQKQAEEESERAERAKNEAEEERKKALAAKKEAQEKSLLAQKKEAEARLAALEAALQKILADQQREKAVKAKEETQALIALERIRKMALNAELLVLNGQVDKVKEDSLFYIIKDSLDLIQPILISLDSEYANWPVKEYFSALQAYYFFKYPYKIVSTGAAIRSVVLLPNQKQFILGNESGNISLLSLEGESAVIAKKTFQVGAPIRTIALDTTDNYLAVGTSEGQLIMLNYNLEASNKPFKEVDRFAYSPDSLVIIEDIVILGKNGNDYELVVNKDRSMKEENTLEIFPFNTQEKVFVSQYSPVMKNVETQAPLTQLDAIDFNSDKEIVYFSGETLIVYSADLKEMNSIRSSIPYNQVIPIPPNENKRKKIKKNEERITALKLSPDKKYLAAGLFYGDIFLIDLETETGKPKLVAESTKTHYTQISDLSFHENKDTLYLAASSYDNSFSLINVTKALTGVESRKDDDNNLELKNIDDYVMTFKLHNNWVHGVRFFEHDNKLKMLVFSEDGTAQIWLAEQDKLEEVLGLTKEVNN